MKSRGCWRNSIFTRFIIIFLMIVTPLYLLSLGIYNWGLRMVADEITNSMIAQAGYFLDTLESEVRRLKALQYECLYDENLLLLANALPIMNVYETTQAFLRLQQRLNTIKNSSSYIEDTFVYIPSIDKIVSATIGVSKSPPEINEILKIPPDDTDAQIIYWNDRLFTIAQYPTNSIFTHKTPRFIIISELSRKGIIENMLIANSHIQGGSMLINRQQNYILTNNSNDSITNQLLTNSLKIIETVEVNEISYTVVRKKSDLLNIELITFTPKEQAFRRIRHYQITFIIFTIASIIIIISFSLAMRRIIHRPLLVLVDSFRQLEKGTMNLSIQYKHDDEFHYIYKSFNTMVAKLNDLIDQVYKQKILAQHAELKQLQSQINPHFLYNSLFILSKMARLGDCDNIKIFAEHLGSYYQFITKSSADEISLLKELNHAQTYAEIQMMRFAERIKVEFEQLPDQFREIQVPRLIIQPILENAFEHGLKDKEENGLIRVKFHPLPDGLRITVDDNGAGLTEAELADLQAKLHGDPVVGDSTGIINIHRRIQLRFGKDSGVTASRGELGGLEVSLKIVLYERGNTHVPTVNCGR